MTDNATPSPTYWWVSIGRNVGTEPLSNDEWSDFRSDILATANNYGEVECDVLGESTFDGIAEDTYLVLVSTDRPDRLRKSLGPIAFQYDQRAIGFVGGSTESTVTP